MGNFGVVTNFEFQLHEVGDIVGGPMFYEVEDAAAVMECYRDFIEDAPEQLGCFFAWQIAPPLPFIPEDRVGDLFCALVTCWNGPARRGRSGARNRFREVAEVKAAHVGVTPFPALNSAFDGLVPKGMQHYWKADFVTELTDEAISRPHRARQEDAVRELDDAPLLDQRRSAAGRTQTRRRSVTATRPSRRSSPACGPIRPTTRPTRSG